MSLPTYDEIQEQRDLARDLAVRLEQENARLRELASCGICGNPPGNDLGPLDDFFLLHGAHGVCLADEQRDAALDFAALEA